MDLVDGKHVNELLQAQVHVWNHTFKFMNSMSLKCAVELGIPDIINKHGKPMTLSELAAALPISPSKATGVYRLMRILIQSGFFARQTIEEDDDQEERYVLTDASKLLLKDDPYNLICCVQLGLYPIMMGLWQYISTWFQNDDPTPFQTAHGMPCRDYIAQEPMLNNILNKAMADDSRLVATVLINEFKGVFDGLKSLVDVGGGTGTLAKTIANAFPYLDCTVLDLPHVVSDLQGSNNLKYVVGDMFESIPPADAVFLKLILHSLDDESCIKILKKCKEAIQDKDEGKVIIIDIVMENKKGDNESNETQLFYDMQMMITFNTKERNEKEWAKLFTDAGFSTYKIIPKLGFKSIIEVYP